MPCSLRSIPSISIIATFIESGCMTCTLIELTRSLPKILYCAVCSGIQTCSSGLRQLLDEPFSAMIPMISNGIPRIAICWPIMATALEPSISGTALPSTVTRLRAIPSPAVNILPAATS